MPDIATSGSNHAAQDAIALPANYQKVNSEWVLKVTETLLTSSRGGVKELQEALPCEAAQQILEALLALLKQEPTVVDVTPASQDIPVIVVGDTHGQLHDVCSMLQKVGPPSEQQMFVFNGDFVDRGAWGLEVLIVLACWKLAYPKEVTILRGNHECTTCTHMYGFRTEVLAKYGPKNFKDVFRTCKKVFAALPLAAVIGGQALILHGGLFRKPTQNTHKRKKRQKMSPGAPLEIGSMQDLRAAGKGGLDPNGTGKSVIATDVLWSDPAPEPGLMTNDARGVGLLFGPDVTQAFLEANKLKLIIRSHEGPDARWKREGMQDMRKGHSLDHNTPEGKLMTVFSAPDYPQFQPTSEDRFNNLGAVAVLRGSQDNFASPEMVEYPAAPRPQAQAFYEYEDVPDSDEEMSIGHGSPSDVSAVSSQQGSDADEAVSSNHGPHAEVPSQPAEAIAEAPAAAISTSGAQANGAADLRPIDAVNGAHHSETATYDDQQPAYVQDPITADQRSDIAAQHASRGLKHTEPLTKRAEAAAADARYEVAQACTDSPDGQATESGNEGNALSQQKPGGQQPAAAADATAYGNIMKGRAAAAFDHTVANQAEAVDMRAGIVADDADDTLQSSADKSGAHTSSSSSQKAQLASQPRHKVQARSAPWR